MSESPYLFVYGTLRSQVSNEMSRFLQSHAQAVGGAKTPGILFQLDGFPGMVASVDGSDRVVGEVYRMDDPAATLALLDAYEGDQFERQLVTVTIDDGRTFDAWVYVYKLDTSGKPRITSGDYLAAIL
jgi:gamma-glutamylcyclotransferase (GGCT)/AIG2-like uncharacterized protein YtfP